MKVLNNNRGGSYVYTAAIILAVVMIFAAVFFYAETMTRVNLSKEYTKICLDNFVMENVPLIYDSTMQGHDKTVSFDENSFITDYFDDLELDFKDDLVYIINEDGEEQFRMTMPEVNFTMDNMLKLSASYRLTLPAKFAGKTQFHFTILIKISASYNLKNY